MSSTIICVKCTALISAYAAKLITGLYAWPGLDCPVQYYIIIDEESETDLFKVELPCFIYLIIMAGSLDEFLKTYVEKFKFATISSEEWKEYFLSFFHKQVHRSMWDLVLSTSSFS